MSVDAVITFGPRTEAWIRRAVEDYEQGLRRIIRDHPELEPRGEFTGGD